MARERHDRRAGEPRRQSDPRLNDRATHRKAGRLQRQLTADHKTEIQKRIDAEKLGEGDSKRRRPARRQLVQRQPRRSPRASSCNLARRYWKRIANDLKAMTTHPLFTKPKLPRTNRCKHQGYLYSLLFEHQKTAATAAGVASRTAIGATENTSFPWSHRNPNRRVAWIGNGQDGGQHRWRRRGRLPLQV